MKLRNHIILPLNVALIFGVVLSDICYITLGGTPLKATASICFVILGLVNLIDSIWYKTQPLKFPLVLTCGLFFAMLGDIVLNFEFIVGAILFAIGHVFYFLAYCCLHKFKWNDLIYGLVIFIPSAIFILSAPFFDFGGVLMQIICIVYALIISFMVGKAIANALTFPNCQNILLAIGSGLFFFSDLMLLLNVFGNLSSVFDVLCLATYYPAECLLGVAILTHSHHEHPVQTSNKAKLEQ